MGSNCRGLDGERENATYTRLFLRCNGGGTYYHHQREHRSTRPQVLNDPTKWARYRLMIIADPDGNELYFPYPENGAEGVVVERN